MVEEMFVEFEGVASGRKWPTRLYGPLAYNARYRKITRYLHNITDLIGSEHRKPRRRAVCLNLHQHFAPYVTATSYSS